MAIVTLSGQIGTNAREVGRLAAERLGIDYVDQEILVEAARDLGVPMESIVTHDERTEGLGGFIAGLLLIRLFVTGRPRRARLRVVNPRR